MLNSKLFGFLKLCNTNKHMGMFNWVWIQLWVCVSSLIFLQNFCQLCIKPWLGITWENRHCQTGRVGGYVQLWKTGRLGGGAHLAIQLQSTRMEICMQPNPIARMEICMQIEMQCKCKLGLLEVLRAKTMIYESYEVASGCKDSIKLISYNHNTTRLDPHCSFWSTVR